MSQKFDTVDVLRLEVEEDPTGLVNLLQNPSGELGGWGWVTPVPNTVISAGSDVDGSYLEFETLAAQAAYWTSELLPVAAAQWVAAGFETVTPVGTFEVHVKVRFEFFDTNKDLISSGPQSALFDTTPRTNYVASAQAPANTAYARLRFDAYNSSGGTPSANAVYWFRKAVMSTAATAGELGTYRANLVPNPSFETNTTGWQAGGASGTVSTSIARSGSVGGFSGSYALRLTANAAGDISTSTTFPGGFIPVVGGRSYGFSGRFRAGSVARTTQFGIWWYDANDAYISGAVVSVTTTTTGWTRAASYATAPSNAKYARLYAIVRECASGEVHYADAFLVERTESTLPGDYFDSSTPNTLDTTYGSANHADEVRTRTNLIRNPSFETSTTGWEEDPDAPYVLLARSELPRREGNWSMVMNSEGNSSHVGVITREGTNGMPVSPNKTYRLRLSVYLGDNYGDYNKIYADVRFWKSNGYMVASGSFDVPVRLNNVATSTWHDIIIDYVAPSDAAYASVVLNTAKYDSKGWGAVIPQGVKAWVDKVSLQEGTGAYFDGDDTGYSIDFGNVAYSWTGTAHISTSKETTTYTRPYSTQTSSNLAYIEPVTYLNVLGPTHDLKVTRGALDVGTLTATILDSTLDPSQSDLIRPGKRCRLTVSGTETVFTGKITNASVNYELKDPNVPESRRARITLTAVDAVGPLANQQRAEGVPEIDDLSYVLEGCGVPWNINGSGNQVPNAVVVARNDNASALDQVAITRDSNLGYAWVDRFGVLQAWDSNQIPTLAKTLGDDDVSDLDLSFNTEDLINEVHIKFLRYDPGTGQTEEVPYGPYRDAASIKEWGVRSAEFTVQGIAEETTSLQAFATSVLNANAQPQVTLNSAVLPMRDVADLDKWATVDLYDAVDPALLAYNPAGVLLRATSVEHEISTEKWLVKIGFSVSTVVASPTMTPTPGNPEGKTIGELLRPVGEVTMFYGTTPPDGWLICNGSSFSSSEYPRLYAHLGTTVLPNFTDRFPIGAGNKSVGSSGGSSTKTITEANMPSHRHDITHSHTARLASNAGGAYGVAKTGANDTTVQQSQSNLISWSSSQYSGFTGGGTAMDVMNPWRAVNFIIRAK